MKPPHTAYRVRLFLLLAGLLFQAPFAAGQPPPLPPQSHLTPDVRGRLAEAARDSKLAPWQRQFMLEVAQGGTERAAIEPSEALPGAAPRFTAIAANDGAWTAVSGTPVPTYGRFYHTAIYDPVRDRMVVFGGLDGVTYSNDVWALSLAGSPAWSELAPAGTPPSARGEHTAIYDPVRDRMVVFGGGSGSDSNDVWALSLADTPAWSELTPVGTPPSRRHGHAAIYDSVRDRMVVFGGWDGSGRNDVWALSLAGSPAWSELAPAGIQPSGRLGHTAVYDPVRDRMVVFGGLDGGYRDDVWALSLAGGPAWSELAPAGTPPAGRGLHAAFYDPVRDRMVVFGGLDGGGRRNDVWELSLAMTPAWSVLVPAGTPPPERYGHTTLYDPVRDHLVVFGGYDGSYRNDVWALSLAGSPTWSALVPGLPTGRRPHTAIYDSVRDRMVVFGGYDGITYRNDVWVLSLAENPAWSNLAPAGTPPAARTWHTAIFDPVRDRMVVFGGRVGLPWRNDVWVLSLAESPAWSELAPAGAPPSARGLHAAFYDPVRDRMVVFGGYDGSYRNDVWALSLVGSPAWSEISPMGTPPPVRELPTTVYDPVRDRMVVFGGWGGSYRNDVWALSLAGSPAWSELAPEGTAPSGRSEHAAIYDPVRDRMVVFAGHDAVTYYNDVWALSLAESPAWSELAPAGTAPSARVLPTAIYDPVRDRMVVFGGHDGTYCNDVWALGWAPPVSVPGKAIPRRFGLAPPRPNPSRGETIVDFELAVTARAVLDVFDSQGRRVKRIADEWFTAGRHVSIWRGDDDRGRALGSGVYVIRIQAGGLQATRRSVRVR